MSDPVTQRNQAAYDQIAGQYVGRPFRRATAFPDLRAAFTARLPPGARLADLGCGPAFDGASFAAAGHLVTGLDRSAGMLATARPALPGGLLQADLRSIPLAAASLDGIWCCAALLHIPDAQTTQVLGEIRRILKPGGHLALITALGTGTKLEPVPYAPSVQRWFIYREPDRLHDQFTASGLTVLTATSEPGNRQWHKILAQAGTK